MQQAWWYNKNSLNDSWCGGVKQYEGSIKAQSNFVYFGTVQLILTWDILLQDTQ